MPPRRGVTDTVDSTDHPGLFGWAECRIAGTCKVHSLALTSVFQLRSVWGSRALVMMFELSVENPGSWGTAGPSLCDELKAHTAFGRPVNSFYKREGHFQDICHYCYDSLQVVWEQPFGQTQSCYDLLQWHMFPAPVSCGLSFWDFDKPRAALEDAGAHLWASVCKLWLPCLCPAFLWGMEFQNESSTWLWSRQVNAPYS